MKLALALICLGGCAFYWWLIFFTPPPDCEYGGDALANPQSNGHSFMTNNDKLERVAARLDDISETLEEIKSAVIEGGASSHKLDVVQKDVERAADAIEKAVDPD